MNILAVGDIVGQVGVDAYCKNISKLKEEYNIDFTIVNGENSERGSGINKQIFNDLRAHGADVITMGNHTWGKKDIFSFIDDEPMLIRPANYAEDLCGNSYYVYEHPTLGKKIGVIDLIGRVDMGGSFDCPFKKADLIIEALKEEGTDIIVVEFHAEATAEKVALGYYLKDKATIVYGTHTHIQTNDDMIYDSGMGYITDIGMTGPKESVIGMDRNAALKRFLTQIPERYQVAEGPAMLNAVVFEIDDNTNKVTKITKIRVWLHKYYKIIKKRLTFYISLWYNSLSLEIHLEAQ